MAVTTDGTPSHTSDELTLSTALSEMESEGSITADAAHGDLGMSDAVSQTTEAPASAPSAPAPTTGDDGAVVAPSVAASPSAPTAATPAKPAGTTADDPLAGTEAFTYGTEKKVLEGVYRVPGEGLLVPEDKVLVIEQLAVRADLVERELLNLKAFQSTFERQASWTITGADGKEQTVTGPQGLEAMRVAYGQQGAALSTLSSVFKPDANGNYPRLSALLTVETIPDGRGGQIERIVPSPTALNQLLTESELAEIRAEQQARQQIGTLSKPEPAAPQPVNYAAEAPKLIDAVAKAAKLDASVLSPKQRELLARTLPAHVQGSQVSMDWQESVRDMIEQRAEAKKLAESAEKAGKLNSGMDKGRQPAPKAPVSAAIAPAKKDVPATERRKADWDTPLATALEEMGIAR